MKLIWLVLGTLLSFTLGAQNAVLHQITRPTSNTIHLGDSLWIYPPSVRIRPLHSSQWLSQDDYVYRGDSILLTIKLPLDSVWIEYRSFPYPVNRMFPSHDSPPSQSRYSCLFRNKGNSRDGGCSRIVGRYRLQPDQSIEKHRERIKKPGSCVRRVLPKRCKESGASVEKLTQRSTVRFPLKIAYFSERIPYFIRILLR